MTTELASYYHELERQLECPKNKRKEFVTETQRLTNDYIENYPQAEFSDVVAFVGRPEELAQTYHETLGPEVTEKFRRDKQLKKILLLAAAVVSIASIIVYSVYLDYQHYDIDITREDTVVIYETE